MLNNFSPGIPLPGATGAAASTISTVLNSANFGQINLAADARIMEFALKYNF